MWEIFSKSDNFSTTYMYLAQVLEMNILDDDMMLYLLTAIGLTPGGSSTVHSYTQTIQRTTQWNKYPEGNIHNNKNTLT